MSSSDTVPDLVPPTPAPLQPKTPAKAPQPQRPDRGAVTVPPPHTQKIADAGIAPLDPAGDETAGDAIDTADAPTPPKKP